MSATYLNGRTSDSQTLGNLARMPLMQRDFHQSDRLKPRINTGPEYQVPQNVRCTAPSAGAGAA